MSPQKTKQQYNLYIYTFHKSINNTVTLYGPCIVLFLHNKNQPDTPSFFKFIPIISSIHVSNRSTVHHQEGSLLYAQYLAFIMHPLWLAANTISVEPVNMDARKIQQTACTVNCLLRMEQLICSKHVEDIIEKN
jgi:hypothetical protein